MPAPATEARPPSSSSSSYIHQVQHLIEKCLVFNMDQRECVETLSEHANIQPVITITVWNELEKENKEFFSSYFKNKKNTSGEDYYNQAEAQLILEDAAGQVRYQDCSDSNNRPCPMILG